MAAAKLFSYSNEYDAKPRTFDVLSKYLSRVRWYSESFYFDYGMNTQICTRAVACRQLSMRLNIRQHDPWRKKIKKKPSEMRWEAGDSYARSHTLTLLYARLHTKWENEMIIKRKTFCRNRENARRLNHLISEFNQCSRSRQHLYAESRLEIDTRACRVIWLTI